MNKVRYQITLLVIALAAAIFLLLLIVFNLLSGQTMQRAGNDSRFLNPLKIPDVLEDRNPDPDIADYVLEAQSGQSNFMDDLTTATLGYNGSYLGPLIRMKTGERVNIRVNNLMSFPTTIHWHGLVVDGDEDGGPHQGIQSMASWSPSFIVDQPAATLWFHPHLVGSTADQVYYGLAGLIYIDDLISEQLNIPKDYGVNDIPLIVQDRSFNRDGSFNYRTTMMGVDAGENIMINGTLSPFVNVNKGHIRFRILNASNSQNFEFRLSDGGKFEQIASDGGFLETAVTSDSIFLTPGERAEVIVDFSETKSSSVSLMLGNRPVMAININGDKPDETEIPRSLNAIDPVETEDNLKTRVFDLQSMGISGTINGKFFDMNRIDEEVNLDESEIWVIRNVGGMMQAGGHPFHVHGTQFRVISRDGQKPPLHEQGYKDTVFVDVGEEVRILLRFTHPGIFMYHCHILEHEDNGMMGQFKVS